MKKLLSVLILFLIPLLLAPGQASAIPTWVGSTSFFFPVDGSTATLDWAVYKPGDTGPLYVSPTDFTYAYTLKGWTGYVSNAQLDILTPWLTTALTGTTGVTTGFGPPPLTAPPTGNTPSLMSTYIGGQFLTGDSATSVWTSKLGPISTVATLDNTSLGSGPVTSNSSLLAPGVPEPATWALLIVLMGFSTWWMRRRQDEDEPLEISIAA